MADEEGAWKTRAVHRKPKEHRRSNENADLVVGVPWRTSDGDPKADGEATQGKTISPAAARPLRRTSGWQRRRD